MNRNLKSCIIREFEDDLLIAGKSEINKII